MADFCGRCQVDDGVPKELAEHNDMIWPKREQDEIIVGLCEGCGTHYFTGDGWPICHEETVSWFEDPSVDFVAPCRVCSEAEA